MQEPSLYLLKVSDYQNSDEVQHPDFSVIQWHSQPWSVAHTGAPQSCLVHVSNRSRCTPDLH